MRDDIKVREVLSVAHHRNGICGEPFQVAVYDALVSGEKRRMVTVRFYDGDKLSQSMTCTFDAAMLAEGNCRFAENSWRGDVFASVTDEARYDVFSADPSARGE